MKIAFQNNHRARSGYALTLVLCFLLVALIVFARVAYWSSSNAKIVGRNNLFNQTEMAAESATELAIATMQRDFTFQSLSSVNTYSSILPNQTNWPIQFQFSDTNGTANQITVSVSPKQYAVLGSRYAGLYGLGQTCTVAAVASPLNAGYNLSATVQQQLWFGAIPLFQFAVFYNLDLEVNPGAAMTINGHVHSNQNIWTSGAGSGTPLTYSDYVEAALGYFPNRNPNDPSAARSGNLVFNISSNNPVSGANSLILPIGTNNSPSAVSAILDVPPSSIAAPNPAAYYESNQIYFYNEADLIVSADATGTNFTVYYQNQNAASPLTTVPKDATVVTATSTNTYYSFITNTTFYDYREADNVKAVQVDVAKFNSWLTNQSATGGYNFNLQNKSGTTSKNHGINSIYVNNNVAPLAGSPGVLPAVRVVNGQQLPPSGLTVVSPQPVYVKGNYNTTTNGVNFSTALGSTTNNTVPAALIGDAITVLSSSWSDANNFGTGIGSRTAAATTINAACLEGIVPTTTDGLHYSGGLENFLRLMENWNNVALTYNGSIVVMFTSQYATSFWPGTGTVYNPPIRNWGFDPNFNTQSKLPPLTPQVRAMIRGSYQVRGGG
jgi:hypothetical protein